MNKLIPLLFVLAILSCGPQSKEESADESVVQTVQSASLTVPVGFEAQVVADTLGRGRHITVSDNGDIYVRLMRLNNGSGIAAVRDQNNDGRADDIQYFDDIPGTGIQIYNGYLYFSSDSVIYRQLLDDNLVPQTAREIVVAGLPDQRNHAAKPFAFDGVGNLYVNVGAPSNACQEQDRVPGSPAQDPCPWLVRNASIWRFKDNQLNQTQVEDGYQYALGLRNVLALDWNPVTKALYGIMHGRDQLNMLFPDLYDSAQNAELPAEEFFRFKDKGDYGWPFCYYDQIKGKKVLMPEYGGDGEVVDRCGVVEQPILSFPGHIAPNDMIFYQGDMFPEKYKNGAFVAFHGSWNRAPLPQKGYFVAFVPFNNGVPTGDWEIFADDFGGEPGEVIVSPRDAEYRPMGLAEGPDGSLYIVDSVKGRIWRISYSQQV